MEVETVLPPDALLERIARTLKEEIGPAVGAAYPKTQAFMASVVLRKLAGQLRHARAHAEADRADTEALVRDLDRMLADGAGVPDLLETALEALRRNPRSAALSRTIEALYATREELGESRFEALLSRIRRLLRARIDRALVYSA